MGAYAGLLYQIVGRNNNTTITFAYQWDRVPASAGSNVTQITATTESGLAATLKFGMVSGHDLLQSLTRPDGAAITYGYDDAGDLLTASLPANNSAGTPSVELYGYNSWSATSVPILFYATSPRWQASGAGDGGYLRFGYRFGADNQHSSLDEVDHQGYIDPSPADGLGQGAIQPAPANGTASATNPFLVEFYALGSLGSASTATLRDWDGHATNWVTDALGRPTQTQECSQTQNQQCTTTPLISSEQWDADNNLVAEVEPRGFAPGEYPATYQTDYAYDANGNTVAVAGPPLIAQTAFGPQRIRPTQLYSYDQYNNVTAYCDQRYSAQAAKGWDTTGNPGSSDTLCPATVGSPGQPAATVMSYAYPSWEPFGEVTAIVTPMGYQRTISYVTQGTDYGLPTAVTGTAFTQADSKTPLQLNQTYGYDGSGNLTAYGTGSGTWNLTYDGLNRMTVATDPDGHASYTSYFPSGAVSKTETPAQHAANAAGTYAFDAGVAHTYDLDGNELTQVHHHGNVAGTTQNWYDGMGRLVEVALPGDSVSSPVYTRYLYDLSAGGTVQVGGLSVHAYGNLYDTKEYTTTSASTTPAFVDARGQAFDALDRLVSKITFPPNADTTAVQALSAYDTSPQTLGLLASTTDAVGETTTFSYDVLGRKSGVSFSGDNGSTPARTYAYDPDGHIAVATSSVFGAQTTAYDADGRLISVTEPSGGGITSPAVIGYDYYPDGHRKDITVQSSALTAPAAAPLMSYLYRADGARTGLTFAYGGVSYPFGWTYSNGDRRLTQTDPFTGMGVPHAASYTPPAATYAAKQWVYDANGLIGALSLPAVGKYAQMNHDLEGALSGYSVQPSQTVPPAPPGFVYQFVIGSNVVGEVTQTTFLNPSPLPASQTSRFSYSNGHAIPYPGKLAGYPHSGYQAYELINGVRTALETWSTNSSSNVQCPNPNVTTETYDNAGRHTATNNTTYDADCITGPLTDTMAYDAENHPVQAVQTGAAPSDSGATETWGLAWGPNGHPAALQHSANSTTLTNPTSTYLHYDGNTLLFTTSSSGQLIDVRAELLGIYVAGTAPGFLVQDRDAAELNVTSHSATGYSGLDYGSGPFHNGKVTTTTSVYEPASDGSQPNFDDGQPEGLLQYTHADGFYTPLGRIQGVRAMDTDLGTWKSPDAYAGDIRDPMSQKPYMWNGNNPFIYTDPSGYTPTLQEQALDITARLQGLVASDNPNGQVPTSQSYLESLRDRVNNYSAHMGYDAGSQLRINPNGIADGAASLETKNGLLNRIHVSDAHTKGPTRGYHGSFVIKGSVLPEGQRILYDLKSSHWMRGASRVGAALEQMVVGSQVERI